MADWFRIWKNIGVLYTRRRSEIFAWQILLDLAKIQYFLSFNEVLTQKPRTKIIGERLREKERKLQREKEWERIVRKKEREKERERKRDR